MKQRTCLLIKPDGLQKKVVGKVIDRLESEGFELLALKMLPPGRERIEDFYSVHKGKPFFPAFLEFMLSGPFIAMVWQAENAIEKSRRIIGATHSLEAAPGTLRRLYGTDNRKNLMHGSDSEESARREIAVLFDETEIHDPSGSVRKISA